MAFLSTLLEGSRPPQDIATIYWPQRGNGRRLAVIARVLAAAGIEHQVVLPWKRALSLGKLETRTLEQTGSPIRFSLPSRTPLLITDQRDVPTGAEKILRISYDLAGQKGDEAGEDSIYLPLLFHPDQITKQTYKHAAKLSATRNRPLQILFAGNCDPAIYDNTRIQDDYGVLNRHRLHELARGLPGEMAAFPQSRKELESLIADAENRESGQPRLIWVDTSRFRIPASEWLAFIARSRFFITTPGVHYPWCQNLNEAMACGSVPVLEYPGLYRPPLENNVNAVAFSGPQDFRDTLLRLLAMPAETTEPLSVAAIRYHQSFLSLDSVMSRLQHFLHDNGMREMTWYMAGKRDSA